MNEQQRHPWQPGTSTGIGSWPGTEPGEAVRTVLGELPLLPHLPELPGRGAGADMIGRTGGTLLEKPEELDDYRRVFASLMRSALSETETLKALKKLLREV